MRTDYGFTIRISGKRLDSFYVDYKGYYSVGELAKVLGINPVDVKVIYGENDATIDNENEVYYFNSTEKAQSAINRLIESMPKDKRGRAVYLTEREIEYIREALINENNNTIHVSSKIKDQIFKKLNN